MYYNNDYGDEALGFEAADVHTAMKGPALAVILDTSPPSLMARLGGSLRSLFTRSTQRPAQPKDAPYPKESHEGHAVANSGYFILPN